MPYRNTPEQLQMRRQLWQAIDMNNNGYLSLAEIDRGLLDVIRIPRLFDTKPVIMRAFQSAKTKVKATNPHGNDYVSFAEFKYLLSYLRQYYEYWIAFERLDTDHDRRVTLTEFAKAVPIMNRWNIKITDPVHTFKEIDTNGGGVILFDEFVRWAIKKNIDLEDDDDADVL
jgi:Ca2+-binding EF-hand superfamily protein